MIMVILQIAFSVQASDRNTHSVSNIYGACKLARHAKEICGNSGVCLQNFVPYSARVPISLLVLEHA